MRCHFCQGTVHASTRFCVHCGADLKPGTDPAPVVDGERKQVTVLFADIEGSMELFADMDPEDTQRLLDPALKCMMDAVEKYSGFIGRIMGDGIMAVFGVPIAQEQHAVLACCAAIQMQEGITRLRQRDPAVPRIRVGINSGEVVVRTFGKGLHLDYAAVGIAARIEQIAKPGSIALSADTMLLAQGHVTARSLGPVPLKGLSTPIEIFELLNVRLPRSASGAKGLAPFKGRHTEMAVLLDALGEAASVAAQVVGVTGEPGVGKSRLLYEFLHSDGAAEVLVLQSNTASYGEGIPYLAVIDLLRNYLHIEQQHSVEMIQARVAEKLASLQQNECEGPILHLLDALPAGHAFAAVDPLQNRQQTYEAIEKLLRAEARERPVIVVFEDLQWHDSLTRGMLGELLVRLRDDRLLFVLTHRPDHPGEWRGLPNARELKITPLAGQSLGALVDALIGTDPSLEVLHAFLLEKASGNPFFLEELVRTFVETGVLRGSPGAYRLARWHSPDHVPPTIQSVIAARIDRLPPDEKSVLQAAAVIGKDVPVSLLQAIQEWPEQRLSAALRVLEIAEFMLVGRREPEAQYVFKHALTHEVAYSGLLKERRRDVHARIVSAIETLYADRLGEQVDRLAEHASRGKLPDKALNYLRQAGAKAAEREAYREAVALFERALQVLGEAPASRERLQAAVDLRLDLRNVLQPLGDRSRIAKYLREAEPLAEELGDARRIGWIQAHLTEQFWMLGQAESAIASGERALLIAQDVSDTPLRVITHLSLGLIHHTRGSYAQAMDYFGWNFDSLKGQLAQQRYGMFVQPSSFSGSFLAWSLAEQGEFQRAAAIARESVRIAEAADHAFSRSYAQLGAGVVALRQGRLRPAISAFELALAEPAFSQSPVGFAFVAFHLGYARSLAGEVPEGISLIEKTVQTAEAWRFVARHSLRLAYLAEAYMLAGRTREAENVAARALALAVDNGERANEAYTLRVIGEVHLRHGAPAASASFERALRIAAELGMRPLAAHCHRGLSTSLAAAGERKAASVHAQAAARLVHAMRMHFWDEPSMDSCLLS